MKKYFIYITIFALCLFSNFSCHTNSHNRKHTFAQQANTINTTSQIKKGTRLSVKVIAIADGDTFHGLTEDKEDIRFRIYGIDAPEKNQAFGNRSKQYLSNLIFGQIVVIKVQNKSDRYGRPIVWVYTPDDKDVSAEMLKAGMAWHYKKYDSTPEYAEYEIEARKAKLGLWVDNNPVAPWDFRKNKK